MKLLEQGTLAVPSAQLLQVASSSYVQVASSPVLEVSFGPPSADFGSIWSSQKARKFRQIQPTTKVRILCFEWKRICFQTRDVLCSYNMNYEE